MSLFLAGYSVSFIVPFEGALSAGDVHVIPVPVPGSRLSRMLNTTRIVYRKALLENALIYHLHDPELLPIGWMLKRKGKKVIYDSHEDAEADIWGKEWIPAILRRMIGRLFRMMEIYISSRLDGVVAATPYIRDRFISAGIQAVDINNYPLLHEFPEAGKWDTKEPYVCYVGDLTKIRGISGMIQAIGLSGATLHLAGKFYEKELEFEVKNSLGWKNVIYHGYVDRGKAIELYKYSKIGIVNFLRSPNHIYAQPNKIFECMAAGIPVIISDFPLWQDIINRHRCGICVPPDSPEALAAAIKYLLTHDEVARLMGENGRKAIEQMYNWSSEARKLTHLYERLSAA